MKTILILVLILITLLISNNIPGMIPETFIIALLK
jgi:hypothetical protein